MDVSSVSQGSGSQSGSVTFSEGPGPSNSQFSFEFPPTPPPSQNVADTTDASTSQVNISVGNAVPAGSQIPSDHASPSPSVSLSSPWGPVSSVHGAKHIFVDVCRGVN